MFWSNSILKKLYKVHFKQQLNALDFFIFSRNSNIPMIFLYRNIKTYNGIKWVNKFILRWSIGYKFGQFTWNRKLALFKAKQLKKKLKK